MSFRIGDNVFTADGVQLGTASRWYRRSAADTRPKLLLYGNYLEVDNLEYGQRYFIPQDAIVGRDAEGRIWLKVNMRDVQTRTWSRQPEFVAHGEADIEALTG